MPRVTTLRTALNGKARHPRSRCPVSCTLDLIGDRWSLLVIRDLMRGKHRFGEFLQSPESIPTNILTERLKRLVYAGIVASRRYCSHPPRMEYELTARGEDLRPVVRAMVDWGVRHAGGRLPPPMPSASDPLLDQASASGAGAKPVPAPRKRQSRA